VRTGINNVFLATDNGTLPEIAPYEYPDYKWIFQERVLNRNLTFMPGRCDQPGCPSSFNDFIRQIRLKKHVWNNDPTYELGALFADALTIGSCRGLVGQVREVMGK
jgi:hypothetical protein